MVNFGMPMGPLRLLDEIGLDVGMHVAADLHNRLPDFEIPFSIEGEPGNILELGHLGKKTGKGFYIYNNGRRGDVNETLIRRLRKSVKVSNKDSENAIMQKLVQTMVDESQKCVNEGIVDEADTIDFAMIMGTGWAPFLGGPLQFSKQ